VRAGVACGQCNGAGDAAARPITRTVRACSGPVPVVMAGVLPGGRSGGCCADGAAEEAADVVEGALEQEAAAVEEVDLGVGEVPGERGCPGRAGDLVARAPIASSGTWLVRK